MLYTQIYIPKRHTLIQVLPNLKILCYLLMHITVEQLPAPELYLLSHTLRGGSTGTQPSEEAQVQTVWQKKSKLDYPRLRGQPGF